MKVYFAGENSGDSVRGIGVHTAELSKQLSKLQVTSNKLQVIKNKKDADIVHFTKFRPYFLSLPFIKNKKQKWVLTIHDLVPLIYDQVYKAGIKGKINFFINKLLIKLYVDAIITISETSKKDICRFLNYDPDKIFVTYLGAKGEYKRIGGSEQRKVRTKYSLPDKFIFYYGDINYNKNIPTLVKACNSLGIPLVIGGKQALEVESMDLNHCENIHLLNINWEGVIRLGFISDEDANAILNFATCLVQPSFYEGFGLSVIHAFSSGCPVISSKTNCLVEVGGNACLYFEPTNIDDLVNNTSIFLKDESKRKEYIKRGFERVKKFKWQECARKTLKVYAKA